MEDLSKYNPEGSPLRKAQLRMLDILKAVDGICRKHNIPYWIEAGTLLGAVRHGGFIPWDDDLDISVLRSDYKRLRTFLEQELPSNYVIQDASNDHYLPVVIGKVRDTKSFFEEDYSSRLKYTGIYIDIFPFEKIPCWRWKKVLDYLYGHTFRGIRKYSTKGDTIISHFLFPFAKLLVGLTRICNAIIPAKRMAVEYGWTTHVQYKYDDIFPVKDITFEGYTFLGPNHPERLLECQYGNYMQIPPKEKRAVHTTKIEFYD